MLCSTAHGNGFSTSLRLCSKAPVTWLRLWTHVQHVLLTALSQHCALHRAATLNQNCYGPPTLTLAIRSEQVSHPQTSYGLSTGCQRFRRVANGLPTGSTGRQRVVHGLPTPPMGPGIQGREHSTKYANALQHTLCSTAHRNSVSTSLRLCSKASVAWLRLWTHVQRVLLTALSAMCSVAPSVLRAP